MTTDHLNGDGPISDVYECGVCGGPVRLINAGGNKYEMSETHRCEECGNEGTSTEFTTKTRRSGEIELTGLRKQ
jgi:DNA-directed RNA polymerase subunit RPC12/RpoP